MTAFAQERIQREELLPWRCVATCAFTPGRIASMSLLRWAIIFLIISLIAGGLGLSGISAGAARISKILFAIFAVLFVLFVLLAFAFGQLFL